MSNTISETGCALRRSSRPALARPGDPSMRTTSAKRMMRILSTVLIGGFLSLAAISSEAFSGYNVVTTTDPVLEQRFLADTTYYFNATLIPNPITSNTYTIKLLGPGQPLDLLGGPLNDCLSQGVSDGMDYERQATIQQIQAFQNIDLSSGTCAGLVVSTQSAADCQAAWNLIGNAIAQRWDQVYNSSGVVVAP
jgi:hypothetical protein